MFKFIIKFMPNTNQHNKQKHSLTKHFVNKLNQFEINKDKICNFKCNGI